MAVLVGKKAPEISEKAVASGEIVDISLAHFADKNIILFFYPLDFTFVCPTELIAFQEKLGEFEKRNTQVIGCSVDSPYSHLAWLETPRAKGGIEGITYPLIADLKKSVAKEYDVLAEEEGVAYRGLFLIDKNRIVRHQIVNDLPLGRSIDEAIRILDALIFFEQNGEVCPANWDKNKPGMQATQKGLQEYVAATIS